MAVQRLRSLDIGHLPARRGSPLRYVSDLSGADIIENYAQLCTFLADKLAHSAAVPAKVSIVDAIMKYVEERFDEDVSRPNAPMLNEESGLAFLNAALTRFDTIVRVYRPPD